MIDHVANPGGDTRAVVEALHRIDPATVRADFERAGFVFAGESNVLRNPQDDHSKLVFDPAIRGRTDRFVYRFRGRALGATAQVQERRPSAAAAARLLRGHAGHRAEVAGHMGLVGEARAAAWSASEGWAGTCSNALWKRSSRK